MNHRKKTKININIFIEFVQYDIFTVCMYIIRTNILISDLNVMKPVSQITF